MFRNAVKSDLFSCHSRLIFLSFRLLLIGKVGIRFLSMNGEGFIQLCSGARSYLVTGSEWCHGQYRALLQYEFTNLTFELCCVYRK